MKGHLHVHTSIKHTARGMIIRYYTWSINLQNLIHFFFLYCTVHAINQKTNELCSHSQVSFYSSPDEYIYRNWL